MGDEPAAESGSETVLADLQLSRSLTIQWTLVGTMGIGVALGLFSGIYQLATGETASYALGPGGAEWWIGPLNVLAILLLATLIVLPHEWLHGLAIRQYGENHGTASAPRTSFSPTPTRRPTTDSAGTSSSSA